MAVRVHDIAVHIQDVDGDGIDVYKRQVTLSVDVHTGKNWYDAKG